MINEKRLKKNIGALAVLEDEAGKDLLKDILKIIEGCRVPMKSPEQIKEIEKKAKAWDELRKWVDAKEMARALEGEGNIEFLDMRIKMDRLLDGDDKIFEKEEKDGVQRNKSNTKGAEV